MPSTPSYRKIQSQGKQLDKRTPLVESWIESADPELGNLKEDHLSRPGSASKQMESMMNLSIPEENPGRSDLPISLSFHLQIGILDDQPDDSMRIPDENDGGFGVGRLVGMTPNSNEAVMRKIDEPYGDPETPRYVERPNSPVETRPAQVEIERPVYRPPYQEKPKVQMQVQISFNPTTSAGLRENWLPLLPLRLERIYSRVEEIFPYLHFLGPPAVEIAQDSGAQPQTWYAHSAAATLSTVFSQQHNLSGNTRLYRGETANYPTPAAVSPISISLELPTDKKAGVDMMDAMQTLVTRIRSMSTQRLAVCSVYGNQDLRKARSNNQGLLKVDGDKLVQIIESASDITNSALVSKIVSIIQQT